MSTRRTKHQCTAHTRSGEQCARPAVIGRTVCYAHGGNTPRGAASPHFQAKGFSSVLPPRLAERYQAIRADSELMDLRNGIALLDVRITDLLTNLSTDCDHDLVWSEILATMAERRKMTAAEHRRLVDMDAMLTTEQTLALIETLVNIIGRHVNDPATLEGIAYEVGGLLTVDHRR